MNSILNLIGVGRSDMRSAINSTILAAIVFVAIYYVFGRSAIDASRQAEQAQRVAEATAAQLKQTEATAAGLQKELSTLQAAVNRGEVHDAQGQALKERIASLEQSIRSLAELSETARAEIDAAAARRALARAKLEELGALVENCRTGFAELNDAKAAWNQQYGSVFDDDRGRKIAADRNAVAEVTSLLQSPFPDDAALTSLTLQFLPVSQHVQRQLSLTTDYQPTDEEKEFLTRLLTQVNEAKRSYRAWQLHFDRLLAQTQHLAPVEQTLRKALEEYEQQSLAEANRQAEENLQARLKEEAEREAAKVQEAEAARIRAEAEAERARQQALAESALREKQRVEAEIAEAKAQEARRRLEAEFQRDEAEISSLLYPFLDTNGESQPKYGPLNDPRSWHIPGRGLGPTSYSALLASGALGETHEALERLYFIGGDFMNLRQKGGFPRYSPTGLNNAAVTGRIARARELLTKYGPLLVERKMLAP